ncbi:FecR domain-containing protein [soil metagenome]
MEWCIINTARQISIMDKNPKLVFTKYLQGKCSASEAEWILEWMETDEGKTFYDNQVEEDWNNINNFILKDEYFDKMVNQTPVALENLLLKAKKLESGKKKKQGRNKYFKKKILIAASFSLFLVSSIILYKYYFQYDFYKTEYGETAKFLLADGSEITLNGNSSVKFDKNWKSKGSRNLWLDGEAFFDINHLGKNYPFKVHTSQSLQVEVLGTKFNVTRRKNKTRVVLNSGKVKVHYTNNNNKETKLNSENSKVLVPGDLIEFDEETKHLQHKQVEPEIFSSWKNNKLILSDTKFSELVTILEETYGIFITVEDKDLLTESFTGSIPNHNIDIILKGISQLSNFEILKKSDQQYIFKRKYIVE